MDADPLQLLWILKGELESIAKDLQPPPPEDPESEDEIATDNGLSKMEEEQEPHPDEEDEKAQELASDLHNLNLALDPERHGHKMEELIRDYLTPAIKQLSKKKRKNKKSLMMQSQSQLASPSPAISSMLHTNTDPGASEPSSIPSSPFLDIRSNLSDHLNPHNNGNYNPLMSSPQNPDVYNQSVHHHQHHQQYAPSPPSHRNRRHSQPGEMVMDQVSNISEQFGTCFRRFFTSLFCGCGTCQTFGIVLILIAFGVVFVAYRASEFTLVLRELNRWKELSIKGVEYEMANEQKMAELQFDLDVDIDKMKEEHQHRQVMEMLEIKKELTREFMEKNTRTVTTTSLAWFGTETEQYSQTIFGEEDLAIFQQNILSYGFAAIGAPENEAQGLIEEQKDEEVELEEIEVTADGEMKQNDKLFTDNAPNNGTSATTSTEDDSFDSI